jgi:hypothetical protein
MFLRFSGYEKGIAMPKYLDSPESTAISCLLVADHPGRHAGARKIPGERLFDAPNNSIKPTAAPLSKKGGGGLSRIVRGISAKTLAESMVIPVQSVNICNG